MTMKVTVNTILNILLVVVVGILIGRYFYMQPKFINGERAPAIETTLLNGNSWSLEELRGKYVLLDFWGSWCAPCRRANPRLVELYDTFHGAEFEDADGFEIVSVGVERSAEQWHRAIARDGLKWEYHILDQTESLKFFEGGIAANYGVKQLPTSYLIDPNGVIVGVNLRAEAIEDRLAVKVRN